MKVTVRIQSVLVKEFELPDSTLGYLDEILEDAKEMARKDICIGELAGWEMTLDTKVVEAKLTEDEHGRYVRLCERMLRTSVDDD